MKDNELFETVTIENIVVGSVIGSGQMVIKKRTLRSGKILLTWLLPGGTMISQSCWTPDDFIRVLKC